MSPHAIVQAIHDLDDDVTFAIPRHVELELTAKRLASGPVTAQAHAMLDRSDMRAEDAQPIIQALADAGDVTLTLGGLGDPLLHEDFFALARDAVEAGVFAVAVRTDLLLDDDQLAARLLDLGVDVVSPAINADKAATYQQAMGIDRFATVIAHVEKLINLRNQRVLDGQPADSSQPTSGSAAIRPTPPDDGFTFSRLDGSSADGSTSAPDANPELTEVAGHLGLPWIVPRIVRCDATINDINSFFDRWTHFTGQVVIEPMLCDGTTEARIAPTRGGLVHVHPLPWIRRLEAMTRLTVYSDGRLPQHRDDLQADDALAWRSDAGLSATWAAWRDDFQKRLASATGPFPQLLAAM